MNQLSNLRFIEAYTQNSSELNADLLLTERDGDSTEVELAKAVARLCKDRLGHTGKVRRGPIRYAIELMLAHEPAAVVPREIGSEALPQDDVPNLGKYRFAECFPAFLGWRASQCEAPSKGQIAERFAEIEYGFQKGSPVGPDDDMTNPVRAATEWLKLNYRAFWDSHPKKFRN